LTDDIVVCSLEAWDDVWRRNQFFVRELLLLRPGARFLFVAPACDVLHSALRHTVGPRPGVRAVDPGRVWELTPAKLWPRVVGPFADRSLFAQVERAARDRTLDRPLLWINDSVYAGLAVTTGWPTVYDITDDWLLADVPERERRRREDRERRLLDRAEEVVVCSAALATSRSRVRAVHHIPNAVDEAHFQRPAPRPRDLPEGACAVYVGTLHDDRIDVDLLGALADAAPDAALVLVGPDSLSAESRARLDRHGNVRRLGARPYAEVPAYLQHATVVIVPHRETPFTASLDPIKAYECEAAGTATVATPVPGFVPDRGCIRTARGADWVSATVGWLLDPPAPSPASGLPTWADRARTFDGVLTAAAAAAASGDRRPRRRERAS
jgi:teichuronic acid biosynthesis glycosyltransferase TuaH